MSKYDDEVESGLLAQIAALKDKIESFQKEIEPLEDAHNNAKMEHDALIQEFRLKEAQSLEKVHGLGKKKMEIESSLSVLKSQLPMLQATVEDRLKELDGEAQLAALEETWKGIMASTAWAEAIKPFQLKGAKFMAARRRVLNADQMGLGKTIQTVAAIELTDLEFSDLPKNASVLWLTKKSAQGTTLQEIRKWAPKRPIVVLNGPPDVREFQAEIAHNSGAILIANYEGLKSTPKILELPWKRVVTDEAHKYKNMDTHVWKNVKRVSRDAECFWQLTGTPLVNSPKDTFSLLNVIREDRFKNQYRFINEYCWAGGYNGTDLVWKGNGADRLLKDISDFTFRRRKDEVEIELPDKFQEVHIVQMEGHQLELYEMMRDKFRIYLDSDEKETIETTNVLAWFMRLRQIALWPPSIIKKVANALEVAEEMDQEEIDKSDNMLLKAVTCQESAKIDECMEIIKELAESHEKSVVFSVLNAPLWEVKERCAKEGITCAIIKGGMNPNKIAEIIKEFQEGNEIMVLCGNIKAMGESYTLHRASHSIFLDLWWSSATNEQCEDRLHRIGQHSNVTVHIIQAENSIDAFINEKILMKNDMSKAVFERQELRDALDKGLI